MKNFWKRLSRPLKVLLIVVILLAGVRAVLPALIKNQINNVLGQKLTAFAGRIDDFDLRILAGEYEVEGLKIWPKAAGPDDALLDINKIAVNVSWRALFHGRFLVDVELQQPEVTLDDDLPSEDKKQSNDPKAWSEVFGTLVKFELQSLKIADGKVLWDKPSLTPPVRVQLDHLNGQVSNIGNILRPLRNELPTRFGLTGVAQNHARVSVDGAADLVRKPPKIQARWELRDLELKSLNTYTRSFGYFDLTQGKLSVKGESDLQGAQVNALFLLDFEGVDVIAPKQKFIGPRGFFTELGLGALNILAQDKRQIVDSEIKIAGVWPDIHIDTWRAVRTTLQSGER